mgnify:CR=1 FL=1
MARKKKAEVIEVLPPAPATDQPITETIENLKLRGYNSIGLYTDQSNIQAQQCYLKCGFDITAETEQKMSNGAVVKRYIMECSL